MTTKVKTALAVVLLLLLVGGGWELVRRGGDGILATQGTDVADGRSATGDPRRRVRAAGEPDDASGAAPGLDSTAAVPSQDEAADVAGVPASPGPRRLRHVVLDPPEAEEPDDAPGGDAIEIVDPDGGGFTELAIAGAESAGSWPEWGSCVVAGRVVDERGSPLSGATVFRMEPDPPEAEPGVVAYSHLAEIATTDAAGRFRAPGQPARPFLLVAEYARQMFRRRGLAIGSPAAVAPREGEDLEDVEVRLPLRDADLVVLAGVVHDDRAEPLPGALVHVGNRHILTDGSGEFRVDRLRAGEVRARVSAPGFEGTELRESVPPGRERRVTVRLAPRDLGVIKLSGRVVDDRGRALSGMKVWVGSRDETYRYAMTDGSGRYAFDRLPGRFAGGGAEVGVHGAATGPGILGTVRSDVSLPAADLELVAERTGLLRVLVRDGVTGEPIPVFRGDTAREPAGAAEPIPFRSEDLKGESGIWLTVAPRGRLHVVICAPGRRPAHVVVDVPDVERENEVEVLLGAD